MGICLGTCVGHEAERVTLYLPALPHAVCGVLSACAFTPSIKLELLGDIQCADALVWVQGCQTLNFCLRI